MRREFIKTAARSTTPQTELLTRKDVAELFQCSVLSVIRLQASGKLPAVVLGAGSIRYRRSDVEQFIFDSIVR